MTMVRFTSLMTVSSLATAAVGTVNVLAAVVLGSILGFIAGFALRRGYFG